MIDANYFPPRALAQLPFTGRIKLSKSRSLAEIPTGQALGAWCEEVVADLYQHAGWNILARRLRGPGCEIDLAVAKDSIGRVIEVKGRSGLGLTLAQSQLDSICSAKKLKALSRGVELLHRRLDRSHESLEWTADLILLSPEKHGQSCLMHLWPDIFSH